MCFLFKKKSLNEKMSYEDRLYSQYGKCKQLKTKLIALVFADTHNEFSYKKDELIELLKQEYDVCILLGDHSFEEIDMFSKCVPPDKLIGILGNHDYKNSFDKTNIYNLNGNVIEIKNIRIGGIEGSYAYKQSDKAMLTQDESLNIAKRLEDIDILISHDQPWFQESDDISHDGLKGITEAIYRNKVSYHLHGHLHENSVKTLKNGTRSICIYPVQLIYLT